MQFSSHRRSFIGTTILAVCSTLLLLILGLATLCAAWWAAGSHLLAIWGIRLSVGLAAITLFGVAAVAAMGPYTLTEIYIHEQVGARGSRKED